jgi:transcriptional regulator with XRE-family HTH domain
MEEKYRSQVRQVFGMNVKRLRNRAGLTQLSLAKATGLTHNFINDIEKGKKWVSPETIEKLTVALNVEAYEFFTPDEKSHNPDMRKLASEFKEAVIQNLDKLTEPYLRNE